MFYFYRRNRKGELVFDRDAAKDSAKDFQGYTIRDVLLVPLRRRQCPLLQGGVLTRLGGGGQGIGYETKDTVQGTLRSSTGLHGHRSGDATVPYASLNYCNEWREELELRVEELEGVEHREILSTHTHAHHRTRTRTLLVRSGWRVSRRARVSRQSAVLPPADRACIGAARAPTETRTSDGGARGHR
jgi:hypothetical protein